MSRNARQFFGRKFLELNFWVLKLPLYLSATICHAHPGFPKARNSCESIVADLVDDRQIQNLAWRLRLANLSPSNSQLFFVGEAIASLLG